MEGISLKRPSDNHVEADGDHPSPSKRLRTATSDRNSISGEPQQAQPAPNLDYDAIKRVTAEDLGREGLERSVTLVLKHVGFESATPDAMSCFTEMIETYMDSFIARLKRTAHCARRSDPTPADFETVLRYFNIPLSTLKRHLKNPGVPEDDLTPTFYNPIKEDTTYLESSTPILGEELDGRFEKEERSWIPTHFPSFPSKHTYRWTPAEPPKQDNQKKKAEAQADARKGELALRRIDRAAKITRQKELRDIAKRHDLSKQRHDAWEGLMQSVLSNKGALTNGALDTEIADHSTIVNAGAKFGRKEVPRTARRNPLDTMNN
ncbi:hypothetical protein F5Y16DRAFT_394918 [Xylariaceae sp. FL0255]|nr:hypothetical protein F5Y16DRAFT_394918 [Xylariaceae sp. FL0255]